MSGAHFLIPEMRTVLHRIEVVQAYLASPFQPEEFVNLFNDGGVNRHLLRDVGPITEKRLLGWVAVCKGVAIDPDTRKPPKPAIDTYVESNSFLTAEKAKDCFRRSIDVGNNIPLATIYRLRKTRGVPLLRAFLLGGNR